MRLHPIAAHLIADSKFVQVLHTLGVNRHQWAKTKREKKRGGERERDRERQRERERGREGERERGREGEREGRREHSKLEHTWTGGLCLCVCA